MFEYQTKNKTNKLIKPNKHFSSAFTLLELLIVIVVIGILAAIVIVSYNGIQARARDAAVQSDVTNMDKAQKIYQVTTGSTGKAYYSGDGSEGTYDNDLKFRPTSGNVIDVVVSSTDYCIRGYNVKGNINSLANAYTRGSSSTACTDIPHSPEAEADDPDLGGGGGDPMTFVVAWGGESNDWASAITQTTDGGYAIAGQTFSYTAGDRDVMIVKYMSDGTLSWSRTWGGTSQDDVIGIIQTSDLGYVIAGETFSFGTVKAFIAKYTSDGTLSWSRTWGGVSYDRAYSLTQTTDGGFIIAGETGSFGAGSGDAFIAKYTSDGTLSWSRTWGGTGWEFAYSITEIADNSYIILGTNNLYPADNTDTFIAKFTSDGTLVWSRTWGGTGDDWAYAVTNATDGGFIIAGETGSFGAGSGDAFIAKYTSDGTLSWSRTWGGTDEEWPAGIIQTADGGYVIVGDTYSFGAGVSNGMDNAFIAKYTSDGTLSWSRTWGGTEGDWMNAITNATDGGFITAGETWSYGGGGDAFIAKYKSDGMINGCSSPMCQSPSATVTSPSATVTSPSATVTSPSATVTSLSPTVTSPSATNTIIVAPSY
ncbi:MAG: prepilin-type N-terminal cleavage/methylation domain-containing protein [Candidatus Saccharimonadaceae bacterium]|nr:prepilin-type N-terminal cleavage/methylation domain-containing protein [Candidatus Saccharimonadaceae bacterium]